MVTTKLAFLSILLSIAHITYTSEPPQQFCTHYTVLNNQKIPFTHCWFNIVHKSALTITPAICPHRDEWVSVEVLDLVDQTLYANTAIPYTHQTIMRQLDINVYVLRHEYEPVRNRALACLAKSAQNIAMYLARRDFSDKNKRAASSKALTRIAQYQTLLNTAIKYDHPCVGMIVPYRALLCALQWTHVTL